MADKLRVVVELGPKRKKVAVLAPEWPGFTRGDRTEDAALERFHAYIPRYAQVAKLAGMEDEFSTAARNPDVVEHYAGTGSTDFWGIPFGLSSFDKQPMSSGELERELRLMQASWTFFDQVRSRVSAEMQKGPRGGGRDRDQIVRHTFVAELDWSKKVGVLTPEQAMHTDNGLSEHRAAYCDAIRAHHAEGKPARTWPLRFLIRHTAYHTLDHTWEMEDKDLSGLR